MVILFILNMRILLIIILSCFVSNSIFSQFPFLVNGDVSKIVEHENLFFTYNNGEISVQDSVNIKSRKFSIRGTIEIPTIINFYNNRELIDDGQSAISFFIEPKYETKVSIDLSDMKKSKIWGGISQNEYEILQKRLSKLSLIEITNQLNNFYTKKSETIDKTELEFLSSKIDSLSNKLKELRFENVKIRIDFIREFYTSYVSAYSLKNILRQKEGLQMIDTIQNLYNNISNNIKNSYLGREIENELQNYYGSKIGVYAPDFSLIDEEGKIVKLSSLKGKYVLLDFWASWCAPCIEEFPSLKEIFNEYKDNLEILGISRDENLENWRNAIFKYEIGFWKQFSLKQNNNSILEQQYFVNAIPVKILINPEGIIIGKWRGGDSHNLTELQSLLKQINND